MKPKELQMTLFFIEKATLKGHMGSKADDTDDKLEEGWLDK